MNRREIIGSLGVALGASAVAGAEGSVRDRFIGVWDLVSCERKFKDGRIEYPYGEKPVGRITYDVAGRMSAQLMRPGRHSTMRPGTSFVTGGAGTDEIREAAAGYMAYYGKFDIDEASTTVIHHVQACLIPSWVGTDLKRTYRFSADRLFLTLSSAASTTELIWRKDTA